MTNGRQTQSGGKRSYDHLVLGLRCLTSLSTINISVISAIQTHNCTVMCNDCIDSCNYHMITTTTAPIWPFGSGELNLSTGKQIFVVAYLA